MKYRTIVADPPWDHSDGTGKNIVERRVTHLPYQTMTVGEIAALPVRDLSDNIGEDAHLYLWTTHRYLPESFGIARGWGFHYSTTLVWCKPPRGFSLGGTWPTNAEFVLFCRRPGHTLRPDVLPITTALMEAAERAGVSEREVNEHMGYAHMAMWWLSRTPHRCACPTDAQWPKLRDFLGLGNEWDAEVARINAAKGTTHKSTAKTNSCWYEWSRGEHSAKPEAFLDIVESVSPGPYLEMFARRQRLGWDTWGNEALEHVEMGA